MSPVTTSLAPAAHDVRLGTEADLAEVERLFSRYYPHDLTSKDSGNAERLRNELNGVRDGSTILVVAIDATTIVGAALAVTDRDLSQFEPMNARKTGYLSKSVVHPDHRCRGIGRGLVAARLAALKRLGINVVYSSHHADNISSARALDANGFEYVETYYDPEKRPTGSKMTSVRRLVIG